jgi:starch synthase
MKILFAAAEATPLIKVGGLADVVGSLPKALNELGHDVRVMLPRYGAIDTTRLSATTVIDGLNVSIMQTDKTASLKVVELANNSKLKVYLVDSADFSSSREVYGKDDLERFLLFCRSVIEVLRRLDWQPDIVHCHDWHASLIPLMLKAGNTDYASIFTIHNLAYQGSFDSEFLVRSGLQPDWQLRPANAPEPPFNFMGQGIIWADLVTTVSETYAAEILTGEYGAGLDYLLRYRQDRLFGIVNGLDYDEFNPATDDFIPAKYDISTIYKKINNKLALQKIAGFAEDAEMPLIGMVSRLDEQKGLDILDASLNTLFQRIECRLVILGQGRQEYHDLLREAAQKYPQQLAVFIEFDEKLSHLIYAGCDMFLMPSRFEPCGLGQLIAMRYGAVPIVRHTGGLADTVQDLTPDLSQGSGFVFVEYSSEAMLAAIQRAIDSYRKKAWHKVIGRIMALDFSWQASAKKYESLYKKVMELPRHAGR